MTQQRSDTELARQVTRGPRTAPEPSPIPQGPTDLDGLLAKPAGGFGKDLVFSGWQDALAFAEKISGASLCPRHFQGKPADVVMVMQIGAELGLTYMQAIMGFKVINGKATMDGLLAKAMVEASGHLVDWVEKELRGDNEKEQGMEISVLRKGRDSYVTRRFTIDDAKRAKLWGGQGPWSQYPRRMLYWRTAGFVMRDVFPDVLLGLEISEAAGDYPTPASKVVGPERPVVTPGGMAAVGPAAADVAGRFGDEETVAEAPITQQDHPAPVEEVPDTSDAAILAVFGGAPEELICEFLKARLNRSSLSTFKGLSTGNRKELVADPVGVLAAFSKWADPEG